jgi:hypothetical protein
MQGWVKLHRELADSDLWLSEQFTKGQAWTDLILLANHKDGFLTVRGNTIPVKRGQVGWSVVRLSKRWKWSRNKTIRFLDGLESKQQIVQHRSFQSSIITLVKYEFYQGTEQQTKQQKDSRRNTNKNDKNDKNIIYTKKHFLADYNNSRSKKLPKSRGVTTMPDKAVRQLNRLVLKIEKKQPNTAAKKFRRVINNMFNDQYHKDNKYKWLTPEFITREDKFLRFYMDETLDTERERKDAIKKRQEEKLKEEEKEREWATFARDWMNKKYGENEWGFMDQTKEIQNIGKDFKKST